MTASAVLAADIEDKLCRLVHGLVGGLERRHLEHMPHPLINGDPRSCLVPDHLFMQILRIGQQKAVGPCLDQRRRKIMEISVERREERVLKVRIRRVIPDRPGQVFFRKDGIDYVSVPVGSAASGQVCPRGKRTSPRGRIRCCSFSISVSTSARFPPAESPARITSRAP